MPRLSVVVPIFNGMTFLPAFFDSLEEALPPGSQVVLIDDGSTEAVLEAVPEISSAREMVRLRNEANLGHSIATNRGLAIATGEVVVQLNTDLVLDPRCITALLQLIAQEKNAGIVGSKLLYPTSGRVQSVGMAFGDHTKRHVYRGLPADHPLCSTTRQVQIATGAVVAMTQRVLQDIGPLDERFVNQNEDLDHCLRADHRGYLNFSCAESRAFHWRSQSGPARYARSKESEARFWARWGNRIRVDLGTYIDEALDHVLESAPKLKTHPFHVLDLSRGADQSIILDRLKTRWPGLETRVRSFRQMDNSARHLSLPLLLPHSLLKEETPFIYSVDCHRDVENNSLWFARRRRIVGEELVIDLSASVVRTSDILSRC